MTPFKYDNPVFEYLNMAAHYLALNLIFIACCIPVFTAGPAFAAPAFLRLARPQSACARESAAPRVR